MEKYKEIAGEGVLKEIESLSKKLKGITVLHVNSTKRGGGVAEILHSLVPLMNEVGIQADWKLIKGDEKFFSITKKMHNLLHKPTGESLTPEEMRTFIEYTYENTKEIKTEDYDVVIIHDIQPIGLVEKKKETQPWIWRAHGDLSTPDPSVWDFINSFVNLYDCAFFHMPEFVKRDVKIPAYVIPPGIDPLSPKNEELKEDYINEVLERFGINLEKPIILQVSRFDRLKDQKGLIKAYKEVKKFWDVQLVLAGSFADDDPEGKEVYEELISERGLDGDVFILNLPPDSHREINALQRACTVAVLKSVREGFGLVVTEAMWKGKPFVGGNVGGIKLQVIHGVTGYLVESSEGAAFYTKKLLSDPELRTRMGRKGKERVRGNFLITRLLRDYLLVINKLLRNR